MPGHFTLDLPEVKSKVEVKGAYLSQTPYYVVRINSNFRHEQGLDLPPHSGLTAVFDAATGHPVAVMLDNGYITQLRAGAAGALAARYLANQTLDRVVVLGSGKQAYIQLKALMMVRSFGLVSVWGRSPMNVDSYARRLVEDHDLNIEIAPSLEAAVRQADLISSLPPPPARSLYSKPLGSNLAYILPPSAAIIPPNKSWRWMCCNAPMSSLPTNLTNAPLPVKFTMPWPPAL
jgi:ornithine cyclodeaminase